MNVCKDCGECCRLFEVNIPYDGALAKGIEKHLGVKFKKIEGMSVRVKADCAKFNLKTKRCKIYKTRPATCRAFYCGRYEDGEK